jgi:hypothetical protein
MIPPWDRELRALKSELAYMTAALSLPALVARAQEIAGANGSPPPSGPARSELLEAIDRAAA